MQEQFLSLKGCSQDHRILGSIKTNPYYLDIPIHFGYRHSITRKVSVFAEAGPYFSIGLFGKHKIEQISATADGGSDPNIVKEDYTENVFGSNGLKRFRLWIRIQNRSRTTKKDILYL